MTSKALIFVKSTINIFRYINVVHLSLFLDIEATFLSASFLKLYFSFCLCGATFLCFCRLLVSCFDAWFLSSCLRLLVTCIYNYIALLLWNVDSGESCYFVFEKWFAVEKEDGKVEREVMAADRGLGFYKVHRLW